MNTVITPEKIELPPGAVLKLLGNWQEYQRMVLQLGDRSLPRIKYRPGEILLMAPLPEHARGASLLADIEPDYCFYIENWRAVVGKNRIDWENDPPPDLVIEIDVTSYSDINDYLPYKVPEVWLLRNKHLLVYKFAVESYVLGESSYYPNVREIVQQCLQIANEQTTSEAIRWLRNFLQ
ncbi:MAG: Uma2 family endonuclease [Tolypothrix carrinoi HA7290-LM1]|jgi:hypothetical protein|nr:Uma2 family endonuclease [Tolypothrix carrinoi HA7290-LM1]